MRVLRVVAMDGEVHHHALGHERALSELAQQLDLLVLPELDGERQLDLAGELRILALLRCLDGVPKRLSVKDPRRRAFRGEDLLVLDAALSRVVEGLIEAFVVEVGGGAVRRGGDDGLTLRAGDDFGAEVIDRHSTI